MTPKLLKYYLHAQKSEYKTNIYNAKKQISKALHSDKLFYVSWSGGKDSTVMLDMILRFDPDIPVLHITNDYMLPDVAQFINDYAQKRSLKITEIKAPIDYLDLCREYGLPHMRDKATQKRAIAKIKKNPAVDWETENGFTGCFWGLRIQESKGRAICIRRWRDGVPTKHGVLKVSPIGHLTIMDIWAYIFANNIPYPSCYDCENYGYTRETIRNSGWLSTDGETRGRLSWLKHNYPIYYQKLKQEFGVSV